MTMTNKNIVELLDEETVARTTYAEACKYLATLKRSLDRTSRFTPALRYNICVLCFEKLFVAYIAHLGEMAEHHVPLALFSEAARLDPGLPATFKDIARAVGRFESICSLDGFGYQTPTDEDIRNMTCGLIEINSYIEQKLKI
jgi:hypothetical protein